MSIFATSTWAGAFFTCPNVVELADEVWGEIISGLERKDKSGRYICAYTRQELTFALNYVQSIPEDFDQRAQVEELLMTRAGISPKGH